MGLASRVAREVRYMRGLTRALSRIKDVSADSPNLICDDWEKAVDRWGANIALSFEGRTLTYAQADALANRYAHWALAQGIASGEAVALLLPNRLDYIPLWMGLAKVGVVAALVNNNLVGSALAHCVDIAKADHVIVDPETAGALAPCRERIGRPVTLWSLDGAVVEPDKGDRPLEPELAAASDTRPDARHRAALIAGETALYIFTSGTTGLPKAAKVTHVRAQNYMRGFAGAAGATPRDRVFIVLPLYHSTGGLCGAGAALMAGGTAVIRKRFSASTFWREVNAEGATLFVYIGELCRYMVNQPEREGERTHRLRLAFGNGLRPEVWDRFQTRFAIPRILEFYGATEGNVSILNFDGRPGSIGRIAPYIRRKFNVRLIRFDVETEQPVRDPDGFCIPCPPGEVGEAIGEITAEPRAQFAGYADPADSAKKILTDVFEPGDRWFRSGDLMRQDADGYFYFVDRVGDTFRWKGENVSTNEVAEALAAAPGVREANVYGVEVPGFDGRAGMASMVVDPGFDPAALAVHVEAELPSYARPLFVRLQREIETTGTFKYRKADLVADGFDPARVKEPLFFKDPAAGYVALDPALHARLMAGEIRL
ncbi:MAG: long-chain-acyl-CoA synthetase [Pseudomonadota bacterium]|nr:long-chain-acyl-CoA synthetase [Pseudomonadota bacterium]